VHPTFSIGQTERYEYGLLSLRPLEYVGVIWTLGRSFSQLGWERAGERTGRANLFVGAYLAYRNPRAHHEKKPDKREQLSEFLLLNHLYKLQREAAGEDGHKNVY
jgi:hypothetical protein